MTRTSLETTDIFVGAFFLSMGGHLAGIRVKDAVKGIAAFSFEGENLTKLGEEYHAGRALVNPVRLREALNVLRDILFDLQGKGARYDRKGNHRGHQGRR